MDFLAMVNQVRRRLREQSLTAFDTGELTTVVKDLVNEASREVLDSHEWSFMLRDDGQAFFPGLIETDPTLSIALSKYQSSGSLWNGSFADSNRWTTPRKSTLVVTGSADLPNQTYDLTNISSSVGIPFTISNSYYGTSIAAVDGTAFTVYCNQMALPANVKQVLSVRNEEAPVRLEEVEKYIQFDSIVPRPLEGTSSKPDIVYVGSTVRGTSYNGSTPLQSAGIMVWPVPSSDVLLKFSYVARPDEMTTETDFLEYVPDDAEDLICWRAFEKALDSNIEDDPDRALRVRSNNEARTMRLLEADEVGRSRRRVLTPFRNSWMPGPYSRWATSPIPSDS